MKKRGNLAGSAVDEVTHLGISCATAVDEVTHLGISCATAE